jgi:hypothetical protein
VEKQLRIVVFMTPAKSTDYHLPDELKPDGWAFLRQHPILPFFSIMPTEEAEKLAESIPKSKKIAFCIFSSEDQAPIPEIHGVGLHYSKKARIPDTLFHHLQPTLYNELRRDYFLVGALVSSPFTFQLAMRCASDILFKTGRKIELLTICAHGGPNVIQLGNSHAMDLKEIKSNSMTYTMLFNRLAPHAYILIDACKCGEEDVRIGGIARAISIIARGRIVIGSSKSLTDSIYHQSDKKALLHFPFECIRLKLKKSEDENKLMLFFLYRFAPHLLNFAFMLYKKKERGTSYYRNGELIASFYDSPPYDVTLTEAFKSIGTKAAKSALGILKNTQIRARL